MCFLKLSNTISISGYHIREAGSTALQELAFTLYDGIEYVEWARRAGASRVRPHTTSRHVQNPTTKTADSQVTTAVARVPRRRTYRR